MIIVAKDRQSLIKALHRQGFLLVADLPKPVRIETRRGMLIARVS